MSLRSSPIRSTIAPAVVLAVFLYLGATRYLGAPPSIAYFLAVNLAAYPLWAIDKRQARTGGFRVPEWTLHLVSLAGGGVGAVVAMRTLRHKTQKRIFSLVHPALAALSVAALGWALMGMPGLG
ncbi:MAG: DUF1294 domain-containing protein [Planctomycetota bacterium]|nr:DUF1294 domain-containing protein [Planctomycetota bacterium]